MRMYDKTLMIGFVLVTTAMVLAGCGDSRSPDRPQASEPAVFTIDIEPTQRQTAMVAPSDGSETKNAAGTTKNAEPVITPITTLQPASALEESDAKMELLMDDLETALEELETSIIAVDQDTLTDATLTALGK